MASAAVAPGKVLTPAEEQERWLNEALNHVKQNTYAMKRALDTDAMMEALKHAAAMLGELRTSVLSPSNYYSLYMRVMDGLSFLENHIREEQRKGKRIAELYELVQHCGNVLPRLYLLITVGSVYIQSKETAAKHVLHDMVEMCRGVQHPTRGLFLRDYLSRRTKDKLPDKGNEEGGTTSDSVEFILSNFVEMTKLWVRMQHQVSDRDREQREKERLELRVLVGTNLVRLSELEGVTVDMYKELVLPRVLQEVLNCKDGIAQLFLLDCLVQRASDEYHLATLDTLLGVLSKLEPGVDVKSIVSGLITRLVRFIASPEEGQSVPEGMNVFEVFLRHCTEMVETRTLQWSDVFSLAASVLTLALGVPTDSLANTDRALGFVLDLMRKRKLDKVTGRANIEQFIQLLSKPLETHTPVNVLALESYSGLLPYLDYANRMRVARTVANAVIKRGKALANPDKVSKLLSFLSVLMRDEPDSVAAADEEEFAEEQALVCRLVHLIDSPNTDVAYQLLEILRDQFKLGGERRTRHTFVPLAFQALRLARRVRTRETDPETDAPAPSVGCKRVLQLVYEVTTALAPLQPLLALPLFLQAAHVAAEASYEPIAYEFVTQAFNVYENDYTSSKLQAEAVAMIAGALHVIQGLSAENAETAVLRITQHAARLLRKEDQSRAVGQCAHLFWHDGDDAGVRDPKLVLQCLQKAIQKADVVMDMRVKAELFVDILDQFLYFYARDTVTEQAVQQAVVLVNSNLQADTPESTRVHAQNTFAFITATAKTDPRFKGIDIKRQA